MEDYKRKLAIGIIIFKLNYGRICPCNFMILCWLYKFKVHYKSPSTQLKKITVDRVNIVNNGIVNLIFLMVLLILYGVKIHSNVYFKTDFYIKKCCILFYITRNSWYSYDICYCVCSEYSYGTYELSTYTYKWCM